MKEIGIRIREPAARAVTCEHGPCTNTPTAAAAAAAVDDESVRPIPAPDGARTADAADADAAAAMAAVTTETVVDDTVLLLIEIGNGGIPTRTSNVLDPRGEAL